MKYPYDRIDTFQCGVIDSRNPSFVINPRVDEIRRDRGTLSGHNGAYKPSYPPVQNTVMITRNGYELMTRQVVTSHRYFDEVYTLTKRGTASYFNAPVGFPPPYIATVTPQEVNSIFLGRIRENANFGVSWAERQDTSRMLLSSVGRVFQTARLIRKGRFVDAAKHLGFRNDELKKFGSMKGQGLEALSKYWLEYRYGWQPLLSDIHSGVEFLHKRRGSSVEPLIEVLSVSKTGRYQSLDSRSKPTASISGSTTVKLKVWYRVSSPTTRDLMSFGITNPALTAWELVPFSFVVDWFLGVGDYLQELDATAGLTFLRGFRSTQTHWDSKRWTPPWSSPYFSDRFWEKSFIREPLSWWPTGASAPSFKDPRKWSVLGSSIALCATAFGRKSV